MRRSTGGVVRGIPDRQCWRRHDRSWRFTATSGRVVAIRASENVLVGSRVLELRGLPWSWLVSRESRAQGHRVVRSGDSRAEAKRAVAPLVRCRTGSRIRRAPVPGATDPGSTDAGATYPRCDGPMTRIHVLRRARRECYAGPARSHSVERARRIPGPVARSGDAIFFEGAAKKTAARISRSTQSWQERERPADSRSLPDAAARHGS